MWSEEETMDLTDTWANAPADQSTEDDVLAVATRAVELKAARGGTMTARQLEELKDYAADVAYNRPVLAELIGSALTALAALGARNAVLEAELALARNGFDPGSPAEATIKTLEKYVESIRRRSLEASNLERLIAEHALPAAMRWVVDGVTTITHRAVPVCGCCSRAPCKCPNGPRWPCVVGCTHPDSFTPGHPERVKERSEAFSAPSIPNRTALRAWIRAQGMTQKAFAEDLGLHEAAVSYYISGRNIPLRAIAKEIERVTQGAVPASGWPEEERGKNAIPEPVFNPTRQQEEWFDSGAEAMRAACIQEARAFWEEEGVSQVLIGRMVKRLEGATP